MNRGSIVLLFMALLALVVVAWAHGGLNGYTVWNSLPLPFALIPLAVDKSRRDIRYAVYGFSAAIISLVTVVHVGYLVDIGKVVPLFPSGSRTLVGLPVYAVVAGYVVGMIGVAFGVLHDSRLQKRQGELP
jgi:hypothetical protein